METGVITQLVKWKLLEIDFRAGRVKTAADLEGYLHEKGIKLETSTNALKNNWGEEIGVVKKQMDYIVTAVEQYDELGGLSAVKAIHMWEMDLPGQGQYSYRAKGEAPVEDEGHVYIGNHANGFQIMHEFGHAYADSTKPAGMDVVEWSAELNKKAGLSKEATAYFGANVDVIEAERFADALGSAFAYGNSGGVDFLANVVNIVQGRKADSANAKDSALDGGPGSGNFGHEGRPGEVGGSASGGSSASVGPLDKVSDSQLNYLNNPNTPVIGGWAMVDSCKSYMRAKGASDETVKQVDKLIYAHGVGGSKEPDIEIAHHMWAKDDIGKALYSRAEFESACYGEWKKSHPDSKQLDKNGELKVYRKGDRINGVECWTINEDGADMGQGNIGIDHRSTLEQLQREGYVCISGFGTMSGGSGEGEVAFVKPTKAPEKRKKTAQSLSGAEKEAANGEIRALKEKHAKLMGDLQTEFMNASQSGDMEALNALPQKFAERMRVFQESVDAVADKYGIVINEAGASGKIASTKQDGNYDESDQNRYNSVTSLDKSSNTDGGPGSGNFGHEGRPGEVGGSAPASGGAGGSSKSESSGSSGGSGGSSHSSGSGSSNGKASPTSGETKTAASSSGSGSTENAKNAGGAKSSEAPSTGSASVSGPSSKSSASSNEQKKAGEAESGSSSSSASSNATSPSSTVSATGSNHFEKGFSKSNLLAHWGGSHGHKDQYPDMTKQEYAERALDLIQKPTGDTILGYKNANGQIVRYDKSTNDFVKGKPDMGIATMFKPKGGEADFNRCLDKEGVKDE